MLLFCGENPGATLYRREQLADSAAPPIAIVFWWRCLWSPHGAGDVMVVASSTGALSRGVVVAGRAEPTLGRWLVDTFTRHFPEYDGIDLAALPVLRGDVRGTADGDDARVTWIVDGVEHELRWAGVLDRRPVAIDDFAGTGLDLRTVYMPTAAATLTVDGNALDAAPRIALGERPSSSAFLAPCETWVDARHGAEA